MTTRALSLKLKEDIFKETESLIKSAGTTRNAYINNAVSFYNKLQKRSLLKNKLHRESKLVRADSLKILEEFESISGKDE